MKLLQLFLLSLCLLSNIYQSEGRTCTQRQAYTLRQTYRETYSKSYSYSYSCGWWDWNRCNRTTYRTLYRPATRRVTQYRTECCSGYTCSSSCDACCSPACLNGGRCDRPNSCICNSGWTGSRCQDDINECQNSRACHRNADCHNTRGSYTCLCRSGYEGNGHSCRDINECARRTDTCSDDATCHNIDGSYSCSCNQGFRGNGQTCTDINECSNGTDRCNTHASCRNTLGTYTCTCNSGFSGNGIHCNDINECQLSTDRCDANAHCTNTVGSYQCSCNTGHQGDGFTCSDINECSSNNGGCQDNCNNTAGSYHCSCNNGFPLNSDGHTCEEEFEKECSRVPVFVEEVTSILRVLNITNSLFSSSSGLTLNDTFSLLVEETGQKGSPETYSIFVNSIREISIAEAEACRDKSLAQKLSQNQLIQDFQTHFKEKRNPQLIRFIVGKLLCIDNLERSQNVTVTRFKRASTIQSRNCTCPSDGILHALSLCEFFECLDSGNVLNELIFGFRNEDECLIFVVDTTGSMASEIASTKRILLEFVKIEERIGAWGCYMLVPFNDIGPDHLIVANASFGPITVAYTEEVKDLQDFYKALQNLRANGGGDRPEYALYAMLEGLQAQDDGIDVVYSGSQMIVITDAISKQPHLKSKVISEANDREVCIHFFVSGSYGISDRIYQDIANKTSGTLVYPYDSWEIAAFTQSYRNRPCRHIEEERRKKRESPVIPSQCQSFIVTEFSILLKLTINALTGKIVTIKRPNNATRSILVGSGNLALFSEVNPMPGHWKACVTKGTVQVFATNSLALDTTVVYINSRNESSSLPSCAPSKIAIVTSQVSKITNASLNFVDRFGMQRKSVHLQTCSKVLFSSWVDLPEGSFILHLAGYDSHGNYFTYNTRVNATVTSPSYMLNNSGPSNITLKEGSIASIKFVFRATNINCNNKFNFTAPSLPEIGMRISPDSAIIENDQTMNLTMLVSITSSRVTPGPQIITLQASNGDQVIEASATIIVQKTEVPTVAPPACGCLNGGECIFSRGRGRCRCPSGYRGRRCENEYS